MPETQPFDDRDREEGGDDRQPGTGVARHRAGRSRVSRSAYVATGLAVLIGFGVAAVTVGGDGDQPDNTALVAEDAAARTAAANRADRSQRDPILESPTAVPTSALAPTGSPSPTPSAVPSSPVAPSSAAPTAKKKASAKPKPTPARTTAKPTKASTAAWVSPMPGAPVSSCYGMRGGVLHAGIDLAEPENTPIHAVAAGTVITAGAAYDGYGISVVIDHGNGILTHYAHQNRTAVKVGDKVTPGQVIGYEGATGDATGPHLHFEVHQGGLWNQIDPAVFMRSHGVDLGC
ncbi:M23 family metallopeptidase [Micromonospora sp. NPDC049523]|uniref:M23 family metallopeptidase n=1 Tax=Micromonospora sp. NPDC049523 TaxID=3155921 RepID=UPI003416C36D